MAKYDGLIIPRSYNDYVNKSDPIGVLQALQLTGVMDNAPTAQSTKPAKSGGIFAANAVIMADSATLSGVAISAGSVVRVLFTEDLTGSDATTGLQLTYNGNAYAVKVGKNGALADFNAYEVESGVFKYLQAYTTLELMFDGTQFIIIGNPVVLSSADYTIYPDGSKRVIKPIKIYEYTVGGSYTDVAIPAMANYNRFRLTLIAGSSVWSIEIDKTMSSFFFYPLGSTRIEHDINLPMSEVIGFACGSQIFLDWINNRITIDSYSRTSENFMTGLSQVYAIA